MLTLPGVCLVPLHQHPTTDTAAACSQVAEASCNLDILPQLPALLACDAVCNLPLSQDGQQLCDLLADIAKLMWLHLHCIWVVLLQHTTRFLI